MKPPKLLAALVLTGILFLTGCASIFCGTKKKIEITSNPPDATITVYDKHGDVYPIRTNHTPAVVKLQRGDGYFTAGEYRIVLEKSGYKTCDFTVKGQLNGMYLGNLLVGGLIGFIIVDPLTGAMWTLKPDKLNSDLASTQLNSSGGCQTLVIALKEQLDAEQQANLVPVSQE